MSGKDIGFLHERSSDPIILIPDFFDTEFIEFLKYRENHLGKTQLTPILFVIETCYHKNSDQSEFISLRHKKMYWIGVAWSMLFTSDLCNICHGDTHGVNNQSLYFGIALFWCEQTFILRVFCTQCLRHLLPIHQQDLLLDLNSSPLLDYVCEAFWQRTSYYLPQISFLFTKEKDIKFTIE